MRSKKKTRFAYTVTHETALKKTVNHYHFHFVDSASALEAQRSALPHSLAYLIKHTPLGAKCSELLRGKAPIRVALNGEARYRHITTGDRFIHTIHSTYETLLRSSDVSDALKACSDYVDNQVERYPSAKFEGFVSMTLRTSVYTPIGGGSYIELPESIRAKKACINIKNTDDKCFLYCLMHAMMGSAIPHNPERMAWYKGVEGMVKEPPSAKYPPDAKHIPLFERANDMTISVFFLQRTRAPDGSSFQVGSIEPFYISKHTSTVGHMVDLLLYHDEESGKSHYVYIKNLSALLRSQVTEHTGHVEFCRHCLSHFPSKEALEAHHSLNCTDHDAVRVQLPTKGKDDTMQFTNYQHKIRAPYIVYADCESILVPCTAGEEEDGSRNPAMPAAGGIAHESCTIKQRVHKPISFRYAIVGPSRQVVETRSFEGLDATQRFISSIVDDTLAISDRMNSTNTPISWLPGQEATHKRASCCYLCNQRFSWPDVRKVADHDHMTGEYRGAACELCNKRARKDRVSISVMFHAGKGYDFHHIMKHLGEYLGERPEITLSCIPLNTEKYLSFGMGRRTDYTNADGQETHKTAMFASFKDSHQFMPCALAKLVDSLKASDKARHTDSFTITRGYLRGKGYTDAQIDMLMQKGIFPYSWFDDASKLDYPGLPSQDAFKDDLTGKKFKDVDYAHAQHVYRELGCRTFRDYHDLYLATDVFLLADVFEAFRDMCITHFHLDPAHYFTAPGLFWAAALLRSGVVLELLTEHEMVLFIEKATRGGISMISHRYAKANNRRVWGYNPKKLESWIASFDANNLYGWAMSCPLPTGGFEWLDPAAFTPEHIMSLDDNGSKGCFLMVDLEYPAALRNAHNAYPLAPEHMLVTRDMASPYNHAQAQLHKLDVGDCRKLVPNLHDKQGYVLHYRNLKLYLSLGMRLVRVHKVLQFDQSPWLREYIAYNTAQRNQAKAAGDVFLVDFWKLANNAVFGKTMENVRKSCLELRTKSDKFYHKAMSSPRKQHETIFGENLVCLHMRKTSVLINKPIYVGAAVLDLSKTLMYDFHYNTMLARYGHERCQLLFTDTDSLTYHITTPDVYEDMAAMPDLFDLSEYPHDHPLYSPDNCAVVGKMKDETKGVPIAEYVGLKPKMYAYRTVAIEKNEKHTAKGISKNVELGFHEYKLVLEGGTRPDDKRRVTQQSFRSYHHQLYTIQQTKVGLSPIDTKRYLLDDGVTSIAYGHKDIPCSV